MKFELDMLTPVPSLNQYLRWHWTKQRRYRKVISGELWVSLRQNHPGKITPINPARVTITVRQRQASHFMDDDNMRGGCKPLMDCLVDLGLIKDDAPEFLVNGCAEYRQVVDKTPGAHIVVEESDAVNV